MYGIKPEFAESHPDARSAEGAMRAVRGPFDSISDMFVPRESAKLIIAFHLRKVPCKGSAGSIECSAGLVECSAGLIERSAGFDCGITHPL